MDELTNEQKLLILNKAIERLKNGEIPVIGSTKSVLSGHFAGDCFEDSLEYSLDPRDGNCTFHARSYHFKLSFTIEKSDFCKVELEEIERLMRNINENGIDIDTSKSYQDFFRKAS